MCFVIEIHKTRTELESRFNRAFEQNAADFEPRYYVSGFDYPKVPVITQENGSIIKLMNWGLVPSWLNDNSKAGEFKRNTLNARAETLSEKPSFRVPYKSKRCLILSHGFFEWQHLENKKIPYYIKLKSDEIFAFAGLYDEWVDRQTGEIYTGFSIITCDANEMMATIHNSKKRMPVILKKGMENYWIEPGIVEDRTRTFLNAIDSDLMLAWPIGNLINQKNENRNIADLLNKAE
jgi:putative SOS response-associated peptidase YedK